MSDAKYELALEILAKVHDSTGGNEVTDALRELAPDFAKTALTVGFGEVYGDPTFDLREREMLTVAVLTALDRERELKMHIGSALNVGLSKKEIVACIVHASILAGFPVALNGIMIAKEVFDKRDRR